MATFFPSVPYEIRGEGEERASNEPELVMRKCLDDALVDRPWLVIQNLLVQDPDKVGTREIDFVVIDPTRGLITIEVKGGECGFDPQHGWHRIVRDERRALDRDAPSQAISSTRALVRALAHYGSHDDRHPPYLHGWFLALVDTHIDFNTIPISTRNHLLGAAQCRNPAKLLRDLEDMFESLAARYPEVPRGEGSPMQRIVDRHILPTMKSALYVRDEIMNARIVEHDVMRPVRGIIDAAHRLERVQIEGFAGTGKTYAALYRARREIAEGRRTLVTCFNEPLATVLGRACGARPVDNATPLRAIRTDKSVVANLHALAESVSNSLGRTPPSALSPNDRYAAMLATLADAARAGELGVFESIVIDEGQDFTPAMLDALEALARPGSRVAFFHDPNQAIYHREDPAEIERRFGRALVLRENLRNSVSITAFLRSLDPSKLDGIEAPPSVREGQPVVVAEFAPDDAAGQRKAIHRIVKHLVDSEGVRPEDVVILSPFRRDRGCLAGEETIGGFLLVSLAHSFSLGAKDVPAIRWETLHRFKGLEAPAIILHDVRGGAENVSYEAILTACSRAQHALYILRSTDYTGPAALPVQGELP